MQNHQLRDYAILWLEPFDDLFPPYQPYVYRGYYHDWEVDEEPEEVKKFFHYIVCVDTGKQISYSFSPYRIPTKEQFEEYVDNFLEAENKNE